MKAILAITVGFMVMGMAFGKLDSQGGEQSAFYSLSAFNKLLDSWEATEEQKANLYQAPVKQFKLAQGKMTCRPCDLGGTPGECCTITPEGQRGGGSAGGGGGIGGLGDFIGVPVVTGGGGGSILRIDNRKYMVK